MTLLFRDRWHCVSLLALLLALPLVGGCRTNIGTVSGQVLYKGKPLPGGLLTFVPSQPGRNAMPVPLDDEGRFEVKLATGEVRICVDNRQLQGDSKPPTIAPPPGAKIPAAPKGETKPSPSAAQKLPGTYVAIPEKYYRIETSELKMIVEAGVQTHNIELN